MSLENLVSNQQKIMGYIKQDEETARKLAKAKGNFSKIQQVLKESATDDFVSNIVETNDYKIWTLDVADQIMADFPGVVDEIRDEDLGIKPKKPKKPKKKGYVKKYKSKTASGKTYSKGYKKWETQEITFLKARRNKPAKEVYEEYSKFFSEERSKSSVLTKFYRVR